METERAMKITFDVNTAQILKKRGLGGDNRARIYLASEVKRLCDPYVPMQRGILKNTAVTAADGSSITYIQPYAHYQYYGEAMAGRAPKKYSGKPLHYNGGPMRGPRWDKRMLADKKKDLEKSMEDYITRKRG